MIWPEFELTGHAIVSEWASPGRTLTSIGPFASTLTIVKMVASSSAALLAKRVGILDRRGQGSAELEERS